ncbi:hypothetical protein FSP39_021268 [Pinctada imbricata]|uniref:Uncharacterized protein n=1 Tax=Pinctada imbricata TaxID=66713 RepID=A0AA88YCL2_PINIB|nr:hypothetical protein FSP39_021268 [Pinctada imbricata]
MEIVKGNASKFTYQRSEINVSENYRGEPRRDLEVVCYAMRSIWRIQLVIRRFCVADTGTMSNIIPMVSSSPPPLDDGTGFDDWGDEDGDDFGNFMGAESSSNTVDNKGSGNQWGSNNNSDIIEDKSIPHFADFGKFSSELDSGKTNENHICVVENHESNYNGSNHLTNSDSGTYLDSPLSDSEVNIQGNINSDCVQSPGNILNQSSTIDSGLSVTDVTISPTAKSEDFQGSEKSERSEKIDKMVEDLDNVQSDTVEECEDFEEFQSSDVRKEDLENTASVCNESNYVISSQQGDLSHHENEAANSVSNGPTSQIQDGEESKHFNSDSDKNDENCYHGAELDSQSESPDQVSTDIESNEESQVSQLNSNLVCDNSVNHQKSEYSESDHVMCNFKSQNSDLKDEEDAGKEGDAGKEEDARKEISPQHSEISDSELMHGQKPTLQPLENILANLKVSTVKRGRQNEHLGEETRRILNSLPDLSFMHSKVLMFPLRHQSDP